MKQEYRDIVIGLGGIGSGAAYWLSRQHGAEVLGIEQFELGHIHGASQDHSRIIRLSYHTPLYVELAQAAYAAWDVVEAELGEPLIVRTGGLDLEPAHAAISLDPYRDSLAARNVPYEMLDAAEIMRRWPQWRLTEDVRGLYQPQGGIAPAARCNAAHQRLARLHGATLLERTPVLAVRDAGGEVEIVTGAGAFRCERLIIAADAWTNELLQAFGLQLPLTVTQEQVTYFATPRPEQYAPARFPVWIWMDDPSFYGFPVYGEPGVKVAQDVGGREVTARTRTYEADAAAFERVRSFMARVLPGAIGPVLYTKTCLYTLTPDRDFVVDTLPDHPHVALGLGAGHAFKFASVIGRLLAGLAGAGPVDIDLAPFAVDRPILQQADPARHWLV
jgi:sarcosine oxidase